MIYLDYNATAPARPEAINAMLSVFHTPGNASSAHVVGRNAAAAVERARRHLAHLMGCSAGELVFTSGATEANNLALRALADVGQRVAVSAVEHPAVSEAARSLTRDANVGLIVLRVDDTGLLVLDELREFLRGGGTPVVSVMAANNETGVLSDLEAVVRLVHQAGGLVHTDATQLVGRLPVDLSELPVDMLSLSAHKFGGPQGVGALFMRRGLRISQRPLLHGGGQERGWRAGTLNVAGIAGMGAAAEAARLTVAEEAARVRRLRDRLESAILCRVPRVRRNGHPERRLPGVSSLTFAGAPADAVLAAMPYVAASDGSACASGALGPSHVLVAMGRSREEAESTIRFSLGYATTADELDQAVEEVVVAVERVRASIGRISARSTALCT
ncbi:MAG: cysteine desulfurase family protein [Micromonosporaceae bacterium]